MALLHEQHDRRGAQNGSHTTLYTLFLPMNLNNGDPMPPERLHWAQQELVQFAGGLTCYEPSLGLWVNHATVYRDYVLPVQSVVAAGPEAEAYFIRLAGGLARLLEQQQIFVFTQPVQLLDHTQQR
jgi:hypothetical protein